MSSPAESRGTIVANHGHSLLIERPGGHLVPGVARRALGDVHCGDAVRWQPAGDGRAVVTAVEPRRSVLARADARGRIRPLCVNLDQIVIVSPVDPKTGTLQPSDRLRTDSYLVAAERAGLDALILVHKADLLGPNALEALPHTTRAWREAGYEVLRTSSETGAELDTLRARLHGRRSILVGESGAGKSSIAARLLPDRDIRIGELSAGIGRGRHTTTVTMLFRLPGGGELVDSPGVRAFRLGAVEPRELARAFPEFRPLLGRCRYRDCTHQEAPGCAILAAAAEERIHPDRLASYHALLDPEPR